jgi:hypothetical protein
VCHKTSHSRRGLCASSVGKRRKQSHSIERVPSVHYQHYREQNNLGSVRKLFSWGGDKAHTHPDSSSCSCPSTSMASTVPPPPPSCTWPPARLLYSLGVTKCLKPPDVPRVPVRRVKVASQALSHRKSSVPAMRRRTDPRLALYGWSQLSISAHPGAPVLTFGGENVIASQPSVSTKPSVSEPQHHHHQSNAKVPHQGMLQF